MKSRATRTRSRRSHARHTACPLCGSTQMSALFTAVDDRYDLSGDFPYVRCSTCGLVFVSPEPAPAELKRHYPADYYTHSDPAPSVKDRVNDLLFRAMVALNEGAARPPRPRPLKTFGLRGLQRMVGLNGIDYLPGRGSAVLEVGFGRGDFLLFLAKRGYRCTGVEYDSTCVDRMQKKGVPALAGDLRDHDLPSESFDFVRMRHVLEHIATPAELMTEVFRILRPGAHLFVEVPNFDGIYSHLFREHWAQLEAPRHLCHFTPASLSRLLDMTGFLVERILFDTQPWHLLASLWYVEKREGHGLADLRSSGRLSSSLHRLSDEITKSGRGDNIILVARKPLR